MKCTSKNVHTCQLCCLDCKALFINKAGRGNWMLNKEKKDQPPVTSTALRRSKKREDMMGKRLEESEGLKKGKMKEWKQPVEKEVTRFLPFWHAAYHPSFLSATSALMRDRRESLCVCVSVLYACMCVFQCCMHVCVCARSRGRTFTLCPQLRDFDHIGQLLSGRREMSEMCLCVSAGSHWHPSLLCGAVSSLGFEPVHYHPSLKGLIGPWCFPVVF